MSTKELAKQATQEILARIKELELQYNLSPNLTKPQKKQIKKAVEAVIVKI